MHKSSGSSEEIGYNKFKPNWRNLFEMAPMDCIKEAREFLEEHSDCEITVSIDTLEMPWWGKEKEWVLRTWKFDKENNTIWYDRKEK